MPETGSAMNRQVTAIATDCGHTHAHVHYHTMYYNCFSLHFTMLSPLRVQFSVSTIFSDLYTSNFLTPHLRYSSTTSLLPLFPKPLFSRRATLSKHIYIFLFKRAALGGSPMLNGRSDKTSWLECHRTHTRPRQPFPIVPQSNTEYSFQA